MKHLLLLIFLGISSISFSQVGRHELPMDTVPIGGETQENKMNQMQAQDTLASQLVAVRDSIAAASTEKKNTGQGNLAEMKKQLDEMIKSMKNTEQDEALMKRAYVLLNDARSYLKGNAAAKK